jgi:hypothetical protein
MSTTWFNILGVGGAVRLERGGGLGGRALGLDCVGYDGEHEIDGLGGRGSNE